MATLGADMRRDTVRLGAIFPPPPAPPPSPPLCFFISTELPSTAPADSRQAQQFPILVESYCVPSRGVLFCLRWVPTLVMCRYYAGIQASAGSVTWLTFDLIYLRSISRAWPLVSFSAPAHTGSNATMNSNLLFSLLSGMGPPGSGGGPGGGGREEEPEDAVTCP